MNIASIELLPGTTGARVEASRRRQALRGGLAPWQLSRVLKHIEENLGSTIKSDELSKMVRLSTFHFFRVFRTSLGVSPHTYITARRIERACMMLLAGNQTLSEIALDCGLCDQSHLCRTFRRLIGMTPGAWRRSYRPLVPLASDRRRQSTMRPAAPFGANVAISSTEPINAAQIGSIDPIAPYAATSGNSTIGATADAPRLMAQALDVAKVRTPAGKISAA